MAPILVLGILASCGDGTASSEAEGEEAVAIADEQMPEGFSLPEGTQIVSSTSVDIAGGAGTVLLLDSTLSTEELEEHFAEEARAAGFNLTEGINATGQRQVSGETPDGLMFDFAAASTPTGPTRASMAVGRER
ncbi:hypothetical protein [Aurantiacibacter sediminis]|uniref:Uncharacterized protein n=1 Tax=Aurantiacibacter sediminis TaxID=2793064 RepID=A0ABS0N5Q6_9SPHN|nr:hypothetical protein [Aurantiacibacter sediminis]MBH5323134.1 hypothetical protein [Aurantiacibacter sediminis]